MTEDPLGWLLFLPPFLGMAACLFGRRMRGVLVPALLAVLAEVVVGGVMVGRVLTKGPVTWGATWFHLDALSAWHLAILLLVYLLSTLYCFTYYGHRHGTVLSPAQTRRFGLLWLGALSSMVLVLVSNNLGIMWAGVEATTLVTAFLICLPATEQSLEAMWKYLVICSVGVAFAFLGTLLVAASTPHGLQESGEFLLWTWLRDTAPTLDPAFLKAGFLFLLVGYGTKAGLAPCHSWLPDAHSQAPSPVSAVFSGFL